MFKKFLITKIEEEDIGNIWFQQDGAMCHKAEATLNVWRPVVEYRIISRRADIVWPPPETVDALKGNIREAIGKIQLHTIDNVLRN